MKTLKEHNKEFWEMQKSLIMGAGVLCDVCKTEMVYSNDYENASYPPSRNVHCPKCNQKALKY